MATAAQTRDLMAMGLAGLCVVPSAVCNVAPHIAHATADAGAASMAAFQGVSVLTMAAMPFATKNLTAVTHRLGCYVLAVVLLGLNFANALDMANHQRESATSGSRTTITQAAALNSRLAELRKSRNEVPHHVFTSPASASAAQSAAKSAEAARDAECRYYSGPKCREKETAATAANAAFAKVIENQGLTERADRLEADIAKAERELADLGPVPEHADSSASQITRVVSLVVIASDEDVATWRPIAFAAGIELLALIGPLGMFAAFARSRGKAPVVIESEHSDAQQPPSPALENTPLVLSAASVPARPAKPKAAPRKAKAQGLLGDVRMWLETRTTARAGHEVRCNEAYDHYAEWCRARNEAPVSLTRFGVTLKNELGVAYVERSKRGYYAGIALKGALQLAVNNA